MTTAARPANATRWAYVVDVHAPATRVVPPLLERAGLRVRLCSAAAIRANTLPDVPSVIVVDVTDRSVGIVRRCCERQWLVPAPCIVVSAHPSGDEATVMLDAGAADYVALPLHEGEFLARLRLRLKERKYAAPAGTSRLGRSADATVRVHRLQLNLTKRLAWYGTKLVRLTPTEWRVVEALIAADGAIVTHATLWSDVSHGRLGNPQHHLRTHIANIRRKLSRDEPTRSLIATHTGQGYRWAGPAPRQADSVWPQ